MKNIILETIGLSKVYMQGDVKVTALDQVNIKIYANVTEEKVNIKIVKFS